MISVSQVAEAHSVLAAYSWHERLPEQLPVWPQVEAARATHSSSGSVLPGIGSQKPTRPDITQLSQVPPHRDSQQTPSVQNPLAHSRSREHG